MYTKEQLQSKGLNNRNAISGRFYLWLGNQLALKAKWYRTPERLTYYQAKQNWLKIKKWEKSVQIYYQSVVPEWEFVDWELVEKESSYRRIHKVFNIEQTEKVLDSKKVDDV